MPSTNICVNLLKPFNHIWNSSCDWSHQLFKFLIIHCRSPRSVFFFCTSQINELNEDVMGITIPKLFKSLVLAVVSAVLPEMQHCFEFIIFLCRDSSTVFHLAFPTIIAPISQVREPLWVLCQC